MIKKVFFILLTIVLLLSFTSVKAQDLDFDITNIELVEKSYDSFEISEPSIENNNLNLDVGFSFKGDFIKYKVTIHNNENEDCYFGLNNDFTDNDNIKYELVLNDKNVLKAGETTDAFVTLTYENQISEDKYVDDVYTENNEVEIVASNVENTSTNTKIDNPKTGNNIDLILLVAISIFIIVFFILNSKKGITFFVLLFFICITFVYADNFFSFKISTKITIEKKEICIYSGYIDDTVVNYFELEKEYYKVNKNTTLGEFIDSRPVVQIPSTKTASLHILITDELVECQRNAPGSNRVEIRTNRSNCYLTERDKVMSEYENYDDFISQVLKSKRYGCYDFTIRELYDK